MVSEALAGAYAIERELGTGGMATVFLARDLDLDRRVAIKVLHPSYSSAVPRERFRQEISLVSQLTHPHIVPIFADGEAGGLLYYVMPFVGSETLRQRMRKTGPVPAAEALRIGSEIARALAYAHREGIVHRDIKPENVLLAQGQAVVADFGIARALDKAGGESLTNAGAVLGTPAYMSPEQANASEDVDGRSDIYSLGAMLHELIHGTPFVPGSKTTPAERPTGMPDAVYEVIERATHPRPDKRYQNADEMSRELRHAESLITAGSRARRRPPSRAAMVSGVVLVVLASAFGLWLNGFARASDADGPRTIAVLPFENIGAEENQFFAAGVTDEVASTLARIPGLTVISRTSVMQFDHENESLLDIGSALGATYALEGTVRTDRGASGQGRVRVSPQLLRVRDGARIGRWSTFNAVLEPGDLFRVQTEIAEQVAHVLNVTLLADSSGAVGPPTDNQQAYENYLRGVTLWNRGVLGSNIQNRLLAIEQYERAIALDPEFALAHAKLAGAHSWAFSTFVDRDPSRLARARASANRAIELEPLLPEAHVALGWYHFSADLDYERAKQEFEEALQIDPNYVDGIFALGFVNQQLGDLTEALASFERRMSLDPLSPRGIINVANAQAALGNSMGARRLYEDAIEIAPDLYIPYVRLALLNLRAGNDTAAARVVMERGSERVGTAEFVLRLAQDERSVIRTLGRPYFEIMNGLPAGVFGADSAQYFLNRALIAGQNRGDARQLYRSALRILDARMIEAPATPLARSHRALTLAYLGRAGEAVEEARRAVTLAQDSPDVVEVSRRQQDYAEVLVAVGRNREALDVLRTVMNESVGLEDPLLGSDPLWAPLRGLEGFEELVRE